VLKIRGQRMYCYELIAASRQELLRIVRQTVALLACSVIVLHLLRKILEMILGWKEMFNQYKLLSDTLFTGKVQWLVRYFYCGPLLFICFIVLLSIAAGLYRAGERNH